MIEIAKLIKADRHLFYELINNNISQFLYREKRYNIHFSLVAVYSVEANALTLSSLQKKLRFTDIPIILNDHLICIAFDNTTDHTYIKAAENLNTLLLELDYKNNFFLSTAHSSEFPNNTLEITNILMDRLEYVVEHKLVNTVAYEDYIV